MRRKTILLILIVVLSALSPAGGRNALHAQENGKNESEKTGFRLHILKTIGGEDIEDDWEDFYRTSDMEVDASGNLHVLTDRCVRKYDRDGNYLRTYGRRGQGPGEFEGPVYLDLDSQGNLYVEDWTKCRILHINAVTGKETGRIQLEKDVLKNIKTTAYKYGQDKNYHGMNQQILLHPNGHFVKMNAYPMYHKGLDTPPLEKLFRMYDAEGNFIKTFGDATDYEDWLMNFTLNFFSNALALDGTGNICVTFYNQNRIDKYDADGNLLFSVKRPIEVEETTERVAKTHEDFFPLGPDYEYVSLVFNKISQGIAVDGADRMWVLTRTDKEVDGEAALKFDVLDTDGTYLTSVPIDTVTGLGRKLFCIHGDRLFIVSGLKLYLYDIREAD